VDEEEAITRVNLPLGLKQSFAHRKDLLDLLVSDLPVVQKPVRSSRNV